jgi:Rps23 Pro-64 3,4-dihydroxylase Tpa1-like proline 4-hydroxylase
MWLNNKNVIESAIVAYRKSSKHAYPKHIVIDGLFNQSKLDGVTKVLQQPSAWETQKHTYSALYVDNAKWQKANNEQRFVQRDMWQREAIHAKTTNANNLHSNTAQEFLSYLRGDEFMSVLSRIFKVSLTDMNVAEPEINTNYFRLGLKDFVAKHADDSPGREVCMLLYLNKDWNKNAGGELVFTGSNNKPINIAPLHNRCVLFDPSSEGSEHWVKPLNSEYADKFRYNVTSWYWSE